MAQNTTELKFAKETKVLHDFLQTPFTDREGGNFIANSYNSQNLNINLTTTFHYTNPGQAQSQLPVARIPVFHPYNPSGAIANTVTVRCPKDAYSFLPDHIKNILATRGVNPSNIDFFFSTQNIPGDWAKAAAQQPIIFRPHYYVHGLPQFDKQIKEGVFNQAPPCEIGIFATGASNIRMDGVINRLAPAKLIVSSHSQTMGPQKITPSQVICSPKKPGILSGIDFKTSHAIYSVVITPEKRVAVTLHWLLNQEDQARLNVISHRIRAQKGGIRHLIQEIEKCGQHSTLNAKGGPVTDLRKLFNAESMNLKVNTNVNVSENLGLTDDEQMQLAMEYSMQHEGILDQSPQQPLPLQLQPLPERKRHVEDNQVQHPELTLPGQLETKNLRENVGQNTLQNAQETQHIDPEIEQALFDIAMAESRALAALKPAEHQPAENENTVADSFLLSLRVPSLSIPETKKDVVPAPIIRSNVYPPSQLRVQPNGTANGVVRNTLATATQPAQVQPALVQPTQPNKANGQPNSAQRRFIRTAKGIVYL